MLGPTHRLFSFTNEYAPCIPLRAQTSGGTDGEHCAAARMTKAMTSVADLETPHWQLYRIEIIKAKEICVRYDRNMVWALSW